MQPKLLERRAFLRAAAIGLIGPGIMGSSEHAYAKETFMKIKVTFEGHSFTASLFDNPSARDLASMLPLDLKIEDYSNNEKITYLPRKLTTEGSRPFDNERPGDLCYYAPWGDVVFFYAPYRYSSGLIRLGRLDGDIQPLLTRGEFPLRIERAE